MPYNGFRPIDSGRGQGPVILVVIPWPWIPAATLVVMMPNRPVACMLSCKPFWKMCKYWCLHDATDPLDASSSLHSYAASTMMFPHQHFFYYSSQNSWTVVVPPMWLQTQLTSSEATTELLNFDVSIHKPFAQSPCVQFMSFSNMQPLL